MLDLVGEVATVHSDFDVLFLNTVPDGFCESDPKRTTALFVRRNDRVFPTLGLTDGAFYRFTVCATRDDSPWT